MEKRLRMFTTLSLMLAAWFFLAVVPGASANSIQDQIDALKAEVAKLEGQQMTLKKQATEAAAALPSFSYRPGRGVTVEAADRSWAFALSHEAHFMMPFESGKDHVGRTIGDVMGRRFRQEWTLCLNNCFYTWISRLDLDGWGTNSALQRGMLEVHFEQINPWLPTFYIGMDIPTRVATPFRQDSSATGAQMEYDLMSRNNGFNTGRTGNGFGFVWEEIPVSALGIPGRADASFAVGNQGAGDDGGQRRSDIKDYMIYFRIDPFSKLKNDWLRGFSYSIGVWFCNPDGRVTPGSEGNVPGAAGAVTAVRTTASATGEFACLRARLQDSGPGGRQTLVDTGTAAAPTSGDAQFISTGIRWVFGPYRLRAILGFMNYNWEGDGALSSTGNNPPAVVGGPAVRRGSDVSMRNFLIGHDIFVWSPKGFLTGSSSTSGSVLFGYHFERNNVDCGTIDCAPGAGVMRRNRVIVNEWDLWYFFMPGKSLGVSVLWYDAKNLPAAAQRNLGIRKVANGVRGGDWVDAVLGLRVNF